jgi:hypothetical protein
MNLKAIVILVSLGAVLGVGGKTIAVKTGQGAVAIAHVVKKPAKVAAKPFVWAAKRVAH